MYPSRKPLIRNVSIIFAAFAWTMLGALTAFGGTHAERPNVVWITSEDNSAYWLGCYGNENARTPNLDKLARDGVLYEHAYSNAPVCAVTRTTLILGAHAPSLGLQHMRSQYEIPDQFKTYAEYLREAGYYVTNAMKTDFNFEADMGKLYDEHSRDAHWRNRAEGQPFFAVFNTTISHESSLFEDKIRARTESGVYSMPHRVALEDVNLPPYLPDDPDIRADHAYYHDAITAMDSFVGERLDELEEAGLAEDTIVFYYSDHGGVIPRAKRYVHDTGTHVPLIIRIPEKWAHLAPGKPGSRSSRLVSFVDFAPTLLSLLGIPVPDQMQGEAFLGEQTKAKPRSSVLLYGNRFDAEMMKFERAVTDGNYRYIRNFHPFNPLCYQTGYPYGQAGWRAWKAAFDEGHLEGLSGAYWLPRQAVDLLFHTDEDPWEVNNLSEDPVHRGKLEAMQQMCMEMMLEIRDTGIVPESLFYPLVGEGTIYEYVHDPAFPYEEILNLAFAATDMDPAKLPELVAAMESDHPVKRYWGLMGCGLLGGHAMDELSEIHKLVNDPYEGVRVAAAFALLRMGRHNEGVAILKYIVSRPVTSMAHLDALNFLQSAGAADFVTPELIARLKAETKGDKNLDYIVRQAEAMYELSKE